jgi:hypothetical protein
VTIGVKKQAPEPARWALPSNFEVANSCNDRTSDACLPAIGTDPPSNQKYNLLRRSFMLDYIGPCASNCDRYGKCFPYGTKPSNPCSTAHEHVLDTSICRWVETTFNSTTSTERIESLDLFLNNHSSLAYVQHFSAFANFK